MLTDSRAVLSGGERVKKLIVALAVAPAVIAGASGCGSAHVPPRAATSAHGPQPSAAQTNISITEFHSAVCNLLGPGENEDPRLVFWVHLQVNSGIQVAVHSLTIQWHLKDVGGRLIATETDLVGPGKPPVTHGLVWEFAWPNTSGLTVSQNSATGPNPVACRVAAISGTATTSGSAS